VISTGRPAAPEVASIRTSASPAAAGRSTGTITPVDVSLCAQATTSAGSPSTPESIAPGSGASPGSAAITIESARNGAPEVTVANFCENSP
jgi:hypothetical protein